MKSKVSSTAETQASLGQEVGLSRALVRVAIIAAIVVIARAPAVGAQERPLPEGTPLPEWAQVFPVDPDAGAADHLPATINGLPNIMVTGYWPPTNEMIRHFSPNPDQNPGGWVGEDWEGRGYNIYAFFPEFPYGLGKGEGDFEVDYQDTSSDFWLVSDQLAPLAIITTGRADENYDWTFEGGARNFHPSGWYDDYLAPTTTTDDLPIYYEPHFFDRWSSLPLDRLVDAVATSGANVNTIVNSLDYSRFLCNFINYHACWYHDLHSSPADPRFNIAAGHIHVGYAMDLEAATVAMEATLRELTSYLDDIIGVFSDGFESGDCGAWEGTAFSP